MLSILDSTKKMLGIEPEYDTFDTEIINDINSVFMTLNQLGVGPKDTFSIEDNTETWDQFFGEATDINATKSYIYLKVRMLFDPPTSSTVLAAMQSQAQEFEWRLNVQAETPPNKIVVPVVVIEEDDDEDDYVEYL